MDRTPIHDIHNPDLLRLIPLEARNLIEIGCSSGALAREVKKVNSECQYLGVEIELAYARLAERYCDRVIVLDIEQAKSDFFEENNTRDCWIFADVLEHLIDPWRILCSIRSVIPKCGSVAACIPNTQHWSVQARLCSGEFRYEQIGLLDRTHLRWFTRKTIIEMFESSGFKIVEGFPRILDEPARERVVPVIRTLADAIGADPDVAASDCLAFQYVLRAVPA